ncbi:MAG: alpha/beta hydrolase [Bacteroidaceae bacterium]|nr:alpha/beta hydrolase [Bacteroidaceae bacterium]
MMKDMMKKCQYVVLALGMILGCGQTQVKAQGSTFTPASNKSYTIGNTRGDFGTKNGFLTSTATPSAAGPKGKFAFVSYEGQLYLYSVADKKFMYRDKTPYRDTWCNVVLSNEIIEPIQITVTSTAATPYYLTSNDYVFNTYSGTQKGVCLSQWTKQDAGNQYKIDEADDFDPTEALATLANAFSTDATVKYSVYDVNGKLLETQTLQAKSGIVVREVPADFVRHAYTLYSISNPVTLVKGENEVRVEAVFQMPFTTSDDISQPHWYNLYLRNGSDAVNADEGYKCKEGATKTELMSDAYQWAFQGNPYDGIVVRNRTDVTKSLGKSGNLVILVEDEYRWTLAEHADGFLLANPDDGKFINEYKSQDGHLSFWNSATDINSIFTVEEVGTLQSVKLSTGATMRLFTAPEDVANGSAIVITPGGGYQYIAGGTEGADWAPMLNELGYTVAVLSYNLPKGQADVPLKDGRAALKYLRDNAADFGLHPDRIGVMGFSAGGHVASTVATHTTGDECPAFQILFYPVITMDASYTHAGSRQNLLGSNPTQVMVDLYSNEKQVTSETPRAYLCWGENDGTVPSANSRNYVKALQEANVPVHTLPLNVANHGFGFKTDFAYHNQIVADLTNWLQELNAVLTGVHNPTVQSPSDSEACYNLAGQRVANPVNGLYIVGGKKMIFK